MNRKILILLLGLIYAASIMAQIDYEQLQGDFEQKQEFKQQVYNKTLDFIKQNPQSKSLPRLYYQVAELSIELNVENPATTVYYMEKVLELNPDFENLDIVLYNIGYFNYEAVVKQRDEGRLNRVEEAENWPVDLRLSEIKLSKSINAFKRIQQEFPLSGYNTEAIYRLGTIYFEIALDSKNPAEFYPQAIEYFDIVASREKDQLQNYGLFQRGWTYFVSGNYEDAISDFSAVLNLINNTKDEKDKLFFEADALENIAYSLIEYDGTDFEGVSEASMRAKEIFLNFVTDSYAQEIILKAIDLELLYSAPMRAVDFYNTYIDLYPLSLECPTYIDSIVSLYKQFPERTRNDIPAEVVITEEMDRLVKEYNYNSNWYRANAGKNNEAQLNVIRDAFEFLEPRYFNAFVKNKNHENFFQYSELIEQYIIYKVFDSEESLTNKEIFSSRVVLLSQYLADETKDPDDYFVSIRLLKAFNQKYPENENYFKNREDTYLLAEEVFELMNESLANGDSISTITYGNITKAEADSFYIAETLDYETLLLDSTYTGSAKTEEQIRIVYKRAEIYYDNSNYDSAEADYIELLDLEIANNMRTDCFARLAEISRTRSEYQQEEDYYRNALEYATSDNKEVYFTNIMASIQSNAKDKKDKGSYGEAADQYLRLAQELENVDQDKNINQSRIVGFRLEAVENLKTASEFQRAIDEMLIVDDSKKTKQEHYTALFAAWTISDSLMNDYDQGIQLRNKFITEYPNSNEAYHLRLQIIGFYEGEVYNNKREAADMYLQLYKDSNSMDLGQDKRENILLKSIALYKQLDEEDTYVALMLDFEKRYPNHASANDFLTQIAYVYDKQGESEKFENMARYIYKKDPSIDILTPIVANRLSEVNSRIDNHFMEKDYENMYAEINNFKKIDRDYRKDGGTLDLSAYYEQFDYYEDYVKFNKKYDSKITEIDAEFLNISPDVLLKVNSKTIWKTHIINGYRLENLMAKTDLIKDNVIGLIKDGMQYDLDMEKRTKALYKAAKVYEYGGEVVTTQIQKFVDVSSQLNSGQIVTNPVQQTQYKKKILAFGDKEAFKYSKKSVELYLYIVRTFQDDRDYTDEWTIAATDKLIELGLRSSKVFNDVSMNEEWLIKSLSFDEEYSQVEFQAELSEFDSLRIIRFDKQGDISIKGEFLTEMKPEILKINYIAKAPLGVKLNDELIDLETTVLDSKLIVDNYYYHYSLKLPGVAEKGINRVEFLFDAGVDSTEVESYFGCEINIQYDKEKLEYQRSIEELNLVSDRSWNSIIANNINAEAVPDSNWSRAGAGNFSFFKNQMEGLENSLAEEIWADTLSESKSQTVYFYKEFDIETEFIEASATYLAQQQASIWINGSPLVIDQPLVVDQKLQKAMAQNIQIPNLIAGKNRILIKVDGALVFKGLIFEMVYVVKKAATEVTKLDEDAEQNIPTDPVQLEEETDSFGEEGLE